MRETEEIQVALDKFIKKSHRAKCNLKAELEEFEIRKTELTDSRDLFENTIVVGGVDPLTQRIPAEKFVRYLLRQHCSIHCLIFTIQIHGRVATQRRIYLGEVTIEDKHSA